MTEFIPIDKAQSLFMNQDKKNSSICATVTNISDLKSGTSDKRDWSKKDITLKDDSGAQVLTAWNNDIAKFKLNHTYKIESPYWTQYEGKAQLSLGKYAKVTIAAEQSTIPETTTSTTKAPPPDEYLKQRQEEIKGKLSKLPPLDEKIKKFIKIQTITLYQINQCVRETLEEFETLPNGQMVGQFTHIIKDELKEHGSKKEMDE